MFTFPTYYNKNQSVEDYMHMCSLIQTVYNKSVQVTHEKLYNNEKSGLTSKIDQQNLRMSIPHLKINTNKKDQYKISTNSPSLLQLYYGCIRLAFD